jgi:Zn-dependent protease/CBS domain-containing protein
MGGGIRLGKIFGINIHIDWSWLFIFLLITWQLAVAVFPTLQPEWSAALNWTMGVIASLAFFASVLVHELAHSLVAKARGLPVRRITLFLFGGVSNIEREPPSPMTEFLVTIVGPLSSFILGGIFIYAANVMADGVPVGVPPAQIFAALDPAATVLLWLGVINIILAIFNLIPGFPLDGGRILRSILWAITGNLRRATRWASFVGQGVAWMFIVGGIAMVFGIPIPIFGTGLIGGLWLAFIGWFLNSAAAQSYQQVVVQDILEGIEVRRLMRPNTPTVTPHTDINHLVDEYIMGTDERAFPVVEGDRLVGLVCLEDVRKVPRESWDEKVVSEIMTPAAQLEIVAPREDATDAFRKLSARDVRQMPVVENGELVGMLRRRDIMKWLQVQSEA